MNYILICFASLTIVAMGWIQQHSAFNNYLTTISKDDVLFKINAQPQNINHDFEVKLAQYSNFQSSVIFSEQNNGSSLAGSVNWPYMRAHSAVDVEFTINQLKSHKMVSFQMIPSSYGRQPLCVIQYNRGFVVPVDGVSLPLGAREPSEVILTRASSYHELEHCLMPIWMLDKLVTALIDKYGMPENVDENRLKNNYKQTLAEILADVYAVSFMTESSDTPNALIAYRESEMLIGKYQGVYAFNYRVLKALKPLLVNRLANNESSRRYLFIYAFENLPLPTPSEIKTEFKL